MARTEYTDTPLTNNGVALSVVHVDNDNAVVVVDPGPVSVSSASAPAGSAENPFGTLDEASNATADVVYIHGGRYEGQSLTVTQPGQLVAGSGQPVVITGTQGAFSLRQQSAHYY